MRPPSHRIAAALLSTLALALAVLLSPAAARAAGKKDPAPPGSAPAAAKGAPPAPSAAPAGQASSAELARLKTLAGEWTGTARGPGGGDPMPTHATVRVVSAGSAVMLVTDPGTPHEMVTMFHEDDGALLATHYCAAMNQPRMKAQPAGDPNRLAFEFVDGTNLKAHPGHMKRVVLTLQDVDHHVQEWTFDDGVAPHTLVFELARKKP